MCGSKEETVDQLLEDALDRSLVSAGIVALVQILTDTDGVQQSI